MCLIKKKSVYTNKFYHTIWFVRNMTKKHLHQLNRAIIQYILVWHIHVSLATHTSRIKNRYVNKLHQQIHAMKHESHLYLISLLIKLTISHYLHEPICASINSLCTQILMDIVTCTHICLLYTDLFTTASY